MFRVKSTRRNVKRVSESHAVMDSATVTPATVTPATATTTATATAVPVTVTTAVPATVATVATAASAATVAPEPIHVRPAASSTSNTVEFFAAESAATALAKPWLRLERGLRLQRFRAYAEAYPGLSATEKARLYEVLVAANDKKLLNTKQHVTYENGIILSVRGLKIIRTGEPQDPAVIKIEPLRFTKRNTEDV